MSGDNKMTERSMSLEEHQVFYQIHGLMRFTSFSTSWLTAAGVQVRCNAAPVSPCYHSRDESKTGV
jgi:hypothetical protein